MDAPKILLFTLALVILAFFGGDILHFGVKGDEMRNGIRKSGNSVLQQSIYEGDLRTQKKVRVNPDEVMENLPYWVRNNISQYATVQLEELNEEQPLLAFAVQSPIESKALKMMNQPSMTHVRDRVVVIWDQKNEER